MIFVQAQGLKKLQKQRQKLKRKDGSSNSKKDSEITEFFKRKKNSEIGEVFKRSSTSQGMGKRLQKEKHAPDTPNLDELEDQHPRAWRRPTTCIRSQEINQNIGELNTSTSKSVSSVKQESEEDPALASAGTLVGNAVNSVTESCILEEVFGGEDSD